MILQSSRFMLLQSSRCMEMRSSWDYCWNLLGYKAVFPSWICRRVFRMRKTKKFPQEPREMSFLFNWHSWTSLNKHSFYLIWISNECPSALVSLNISYWLQVVPSPTVTHFRGCHYRHLHPWFWQRTGMLSIGRVAFEFAEKLLKKMLTSYSTPPVFVQ